MIFASLLAIRTIASLLRESTISISLSCITLTAHGNTHGIGVQVKFVCGEMSLVLDLLTAQEQLATIYTLKT